MLEINTIYDKSLDRRLMRGIKTRFGLISNLPWCELNLLLPQKREQLVF